MIEDAFNELTNNFNENEKSIRENKYIIHELKLYDFEEKIGRISLLGTMLFLPVWIGTFFLGIPTIYLPLINIATSYGIGFIGNFLMEKKANCKERFKKITKSKNESERIEEVLRNQMNIERLQQRNEIITRVKDRHNEDINIFNKLSNNKRFSVKYNKSNYSKNELEKRIKDIETKLIEEYAKLDKISNESFIKETENNSNDKLSHIFYSMLSTAVVLALSVVSLFPIMMNPLPAPSLVPLITTLGLGGLVFTGALTHYSLKRRNTKKAIKSIKEKDFVNFEHNDLELNDIKSKIVNLLYKLNTYKNELSSYDTIYENNNLLNNKNLNQTAVLEQGFGLDTEMKLTLK